MLIFAQVKKAIIGLGYDVLSLSVEFGNNAPVVGFDIYQKMYGLQIMIYEPALSEFASTLSDCIVEAKLNNLKHQCDVIISNRLGG